MPKVEVSEKTKPKKMLDAREIDGVSILGLEEVKPGI